MKEPRLRFLEDEIERYHKALVQIVNILGAPRECPSCECQGCTYEMVEACKKGLITLGYLEEIDESPPRYNEPIPDALNAWERFMYVEMGVKLNPNWRKDE